MGRAVPDLPAARIGAAGTHTPWSYDAQTVQIYERLTALHLSARPLILRLWREADQTGIPITRPLWLAYPGDAQAARQDQEWLLGPDVLVAPVVTESATSRTVYFPSGCWQRPDTGARYQGPGSATVPAALDQLPYFFHCGTQPFAAPSSGCPPARGRLGGSRLGPARLGQRRRALRKTLIRSRLGKRRYLDSFCLAGGRIRAGYPPPALLRRLTPRRRRQVRGRAVLLLTANRHYALDGIRPGTRWRSDRRRLRRARRYRVGRNTWYLTAGRVSTGVLEVQHGRVEEIGIANCALTSTRRSARAFLRSFR